MNSTLEPAREANARQARWLTYLVYFQAALLALTYAEGMWSALTVPSFSVTLPDVIEHGVASSGFALMTGVVGFVAALRGQRRVAGANLVLFVVTVIAGSTGFTFLANTTDPGQIAMTNLSMISTVALGMPITGFSLISVSRASKGITGETAPATVMIYLALGALALTIVAGAAMLSTTPSWYAFAVSTHVGLGALLVALVLGVLVTSVMGAFGGEGTAWEPQTVAYSLVALGSATIAGADGVVYMTSGDISYVIVMAEVGVLVYAFLMIACAGPYRLKTGRRDSETPARAMT